MEPNLNLQAAEEVVPPPQLPANPRNRRQRQRVPGPQTFMLLRRAQHFCRLCRHDTIGFATLKGLRTHNTTVHHLDVASSANRVMVDAVERLECAVCFKTFRSPPKLRMHHAAAHPNPRVTRPVTCNQCGRTFKSKRYLGFHTERVHPTGPPAWCPTCGKKFKCEFLMNAHVARMHHAPANAD